jgi:hypothetical protein
LAVKSSTVNSSLLLLNLGLLALVGFLVSQRSRPGNDSASSVPPVVVVSNPPQVIVKGVPPRIVTVTNEFQWRQLETEDYREYIARLRSIHCPEQTIRDIIIADLDKLLSPRVNAIYGRRDDLQYWHSEEEELANDRDHREWARREREIDREKREIIMELLGVDVVRERMKLKGYQDYYERRLGFLPENKRTSVRMVLEEYDELEKAIAARRQDADGAASEDDRLELLRLRSEKQEALSGLLSPEEQQLYDLWMSPTANTVRYAFYGLNATEQEFKSVFELRQAFDKQWDPDTLRMDDTGQLEQWSQAKQELDRQIKETLGDSRYRDYRRGEDPDWHRLNTAVTRYGLPRELSAKAYDLKQTYLEMRSVVENDPKLNPRQRELALNEIAVESQKAIQETLGEKAYRYFRSDRSANWLK